MASQTCGGPATENGEPTLTDDPRSPAKITNQQHIVTDNSAQARLRPYQQRGLDEIKASYLAGSASTLYVAPTGSGKTVLFVALVDGVMRKGKRVLIVAHRAEIIEQIAEALTLLGIPHGLIAAGHPERPKHQVQIASVSTLVRRLDRLGHFDLIVVDEAHHAVAGSWRRVIAALPHAKVLGVTATPERLDGRGLGDIFDEMVIGPTTAELIEASYLSRFTCYAPIEAPDLSSISTRAGDYALDELSGLMARPIVIGSAVSAYEQQCAGKRAIVYGVDIRHSTMLAERFAERGHKAVHLDGNTPKDQRKAIIKALATGEIQVITNCGLISEGLDVPSVEAVILARPTQSLALYLQQVGRALRPAPGKERAVILDCSGNLYRFGMPDAEREWSLEGKQRKQREQRAPQLRRCECCAAINRPKAPTCTACGASLKPTPIEQREIDAELRRIEHLKHIEALREMTYRKAIEWAGRDEIKLHQVAAARGYKPGWVWYQLNGGQS